MIATSFEQSQRLLAAGINPETADMIGSYITKGDKKRWWINVGNYKNRGGKNMAPIPVWSLAALWNISRDLELLFDTNLDSAEHILDTLVEQLIGYYTQ